MRRERRQQRAERRQRPGRRAAGGRRRRGCRPDRGSGRTRRSARARRRSAGAPKRRRRKLRVVAVVDERAVERLGELADRARSPRSSRHARRSRSVRSAWWKSSAHGGVATPAAALGGRITRGSFSPLSAITSAPGSDRVHARGRSRRRCARALDVEDRVDRVEPQPVDARSRGPSPRRSAAPTRGPDRTRRRRS